MTFATGSHAAPGDTLYATGGDITVMFYSQPGDAVDNTLFSVNGGPEIFPNQTTDFLATYDLGTFAAGTQLVVALDNKSSGYTYYTGPASLNPDNLIHANVQAAGDGLTLVGFEDTFGGGDQDLFTDDQYVFSGGVTVAPAVAAVPEPGTYALMLAGLGVIGWSASRRKSKPSN